MKTYIKNIFLSLILIFLVNSCQEDEIMHYEGKPFIYYNFLTGGDGDRKKSIDSTSVFFAYNNNVDEFIVRIPYKMSGMPADEPRLVNVKVVDSLTTAREGIDFEIIDSYYPAGIREMSNIQIKIINTDSLKKTTLTLAVVLAANENFNVDFNGLLYNLNKSKYTERELEAFKHPIYKIHFNDIYSRPLGWVKYEVRLNRFFGAYSVEKYKLILQVCELDNDYFEFSDDATYNARFPISLGFAFVGMVNQYLTAYKELHGKPLLDENDEEITMGYPYQ